MAEQPPPAIQGKGSRGPPARELYGRFLVQKCSWRGRYRRVLAIGPDQVRPPPGAAPLDASPPPGSRLGSPSTPRGGGRAVPAGRRARQPGPRPAPAPDGGKGGEARRAESSLMARSMDCD